MSLNKDRGGPRITEASKSGHFHLMGVIGIIGCLLGVCLVGEKIGRRLDAHICGVTGAAMGGVFVFGLIEAHRRARGLINILMAFIWAIGFGVVAKVVAFVFLGGVIEQFLWEVGELASSVLIGAVLSHFFARALTSSHFKIERLSDCTATENRRRPNQVLQLLGAFAWLCNKQNRENIELITADLRKDATEMRRKRHREFFVQCVLLWHVVAKTIVPIMWDGFCRLLSAFVPVGKIISKIKGD